MIEGGNVYLCVQRERQGKYYLELQSNKKIKSNNEDLEECKIDICMQIMEWNGDGEAVLELISGQIKKYPTGVERYRHLGYNESVHILNTNNPFADGRCKKCLHELGERTDELLDLEWRPKNVIVAVKRRAKKDENDYSRMFKQIMIYHKKFIELLTDEEKSIFATRPVLIKGKPSDYLELIAKNIVQECGHKGADYYRGIVRSWKCSECGYYQYELYASEYQDSIAFVDPKTIEDDPTVFFFKNGMHTLLAMRIDRWAEFLKHKKEIKGIATDPVVVLKEEYVEYPKLYEPEKFEW